MFSHLVAKLNNYVKMVLHQNWSTSKCIETFLFDRPEEPLALGRDNFAFEIPEKFLPDRYKTRATAIHGPASPTGQKVQLKDIELPDISQIVALGRHRNFNIFNRHHSELAAKLITILMSMPDIDSFFSACVYCREQVNPFLFVYAASVAILHRNDTRDITLPSNSEVFPELYVHSTVFSLIKEEVGVVPPNSRKAVKIPRDNTASDLDIEHRIAYWREDIGLNLHHWHWHLVYPFEGSREIVAKDRRGELFYYMHQQMLARYNFERLSNKLARVRRMNNFRDPIPEGYYPKLGNSVTNRDWPSRQPNSYLKDLNRETDDLGLKIDINQMERWSDRILNDIHDKTVINSEGKNVPLDEEKGIDILGNIVEASILSVNSSRYGDLHNSGHTILGYIHDPDHKYLESEGVMGTHATSMRDPVFYAWHAYINDIFEEYKLTLPAYTDEQLTFQDIYIRSFEVQYESHSRVNEFTTYWNDDEVDIAKGLNFQNRGPAKVIFTHLQHDNFRYYIQVENDGKERQGTVRIFMAPKNDERNKNFSFDAQRRLFIEMDKFTVKLNPGQNVIKRKSTDSSVTIPFEQTFRKREQPKQGSTANEEFNYCGCGWPQHLLIPKGTHQGMQAELFVMISDAELDKVQQPESFKKPKCHDAQSYCGLRGGLYPDRRAMGFPFDRRARVGVTTLDKFLTPNMYKQNVGIKFTDS